MEKILISVYVLAIEETYDILVPINISMTTALEIIQQTIKELSGGIYTINEDCSLYNEEGLLINKNNTVKFSGMKNGCKLLLK